MNVSEFPRIRLVSLIHRMDMLSVTGFLSLSGQIAIPPLIINNFCKSQVTRLPVVFSSNILIFVLFIKIQAT